MTLPVIAIGVSSVSICVGSSLPSLAQSTRTRKDSWAEKIKIPILYANVQWNSMLQYMENAMTIKLARITYAERLNRSAAMQQIR